jgi:hypothetical protein
VRNISSKLAKAAVAWLIYDVPGFMVLGSGRAVLCSLALAIPPVKETRLICSMCRNDLALSALRGITITLSKADIFSKTFMIGDNLAVGAAIAILCRSPQLTLKTFVRLGIAVGCISGSILLILANIGHTLKGDSLGASLGYSMLEWLTGAMLILMLYAYRTAPLQRGLSILVFFGEISYGLYLIHMLCEMLRPSLRRCLFGAYGGFAHSICDSEWCRDLAGNPLKALL